MKLKHRPLASSQIIILGFLAVILAGCLLLMLPVSTRTPGGASFTDALFTSTSAVCVTGLIVQDTATYWSTFGHAVIMVLIQIGGMGVVTVAAIFAFAAGKRINLRHRSVMQDALSAPQVGGIVKMTGFIIKMVFLIEIGGAVLLSPVFIREFGVWKGIGYSLFHSVSAFCNAGFDLMGSRTPYSSLTSYVENPLVNTVIMLLIVVGGIGFFVWDDIRTHKHHLRHYRLQSKVALVTSAVLILLPALYFFLFEYGEASLGMRIQASLFQSVTARTAGFNTTNLALFSDAGLALMTLLMLIGGSPGSTAGGMKTTTLTVLFATAISVFRRREETQLFGRRLETTAVRHAATVLMMYSVLFLGGALVISRIEDLPLLTCLFETASAVGTVGLSLSVTPTLSGASQIILILLMFFGRVGGLTLVYAVLPGQRIPAKLPQERITVG